ncbi:unnamed protein product [Rotaria magnacalcarata]
MENKVDLLIYLYLFFYLLPLKMKNENGSIQYQTNSIRRTYTWERTMKIDFGHMGLPIQTSALKNALQRVHILTLSHCKTLKHL